jgi:Protein of unknown function (DUF3828)
MNTKSIGSAFGLRGMILGAAVAASMCPTAPASARDVGAKAFLNAIYREYLGKSGTGKGVPLTNTKSVRGYFTVGLASLILEDRATATRRGEPPVLDGDPFIGHQDWDISEIAVEVKATDAVKTTASVAFTNAGKPERVTLELLRTGAEWRIADIAWDSGTLRGLYRLRAAQDAAPR